MAGWVLRMSRRYPEAWTWRGGRRREVALLSQLRRSGVPVPDGATVIEERNGLPTAILERRIVGTALSPESIAAVLDRLHSFDIGYGIGRRVPRDNPTAEFRQALAAITALEGRTSIRTLCHRDFRVEHLLVGADGELVGLLDFGEIGVDDPAVDLAFLHGKLGATASPGSVRRWRQQTLT